MTCLKCANRGVIRVRYRDDLLVTDYAICDCGRGQRYRTVQGLALVGALYGRVPGTQIRFLEQFNDEDVPAPVPAFDVAEAGRAKPKRAKL